MEGGSGGPDEVTKPSGGGNMAKRAVEDPIFECLLALERAAKKATTNDDEAAADGGYGVVSHQATTGGSQVRGLAQP